jgi:hypothetical protein
MSRTFYGIGKLDPKLKTIVLKGAKAQVKQAFETLRAKHPAKTDAKRLLEFDTWHSASCDALISYYNKALDRLTVVRLTYGQAQKWLNMTLKYCWVCGGPELQWLEPWFRSAHIAVDEVILVAAEKEGVVTGRPCPKWSKWNSGPQYDCFQKTVRNAAAIQNKSPLELEFDWWAKYRPQVTSYEKGD